MAQITDELVQVEQELRSLISALESGSTQSIPLLDAIESEIREFKKLSPANVQLSSTATPAPRPTRSGSPCSRSHARRSRTPPSTVTPTNVEIRLSGTATTVSLQIKDDGRGFIPEEAERPGHFGLSGMRERAEMLGGEFQVESRPGGPTTVTATLQSWRPPGP